ncbi:MAG: glycosyltransferase family 4 protein [Flavobacteriales bacterium]|nr:glycosyltransferase family 4 protein [Flavobacteriales bacterium]
MPRIHLIVPHRPDRSPSQRYRLEQFIGHFEANGYSVVYANLLGRLGDRVLYSRGRLFLKLLLLVKAFFRRLRDVWRVKKDDIVIIHREAFLTRGTFFEKALRSRTRHLVFDFDDAIWHMDVSEANKRLSWLKDPSKTDRIIAMADLVIAGNDYLAEHARAFNSKVVVIPTVIDTARYRPMHRPRADGRITIGWTGSLTSVAHLALAVPTLRKVQQRFGERVVFRVISDRVFEAEGLHVENVRWNSATEVEDLAPIDIGIMPLPDNEWSRGKCGFKGLQYMGMGKAVVLADIGVNKVIVQHGVNGLLAATSIDIETHLVHLVEDAELRTRLGAEARRTVEDRYSVNAWKDVYIRHFQELTQH